MLILISILFHHHIPCFSFLLSFRNYTIIKEYYSAFVEASNIQQKTEAIAFVSDVLKAVRSDKTFANAKYVIKNCESFLKKMNDLSFLQKKQ